MDLIRIRDLEVFYRVGVPDEERANAQRLSIDIDLELNFEAAAATDDLSRTIDYFALTRRLLAYGEGREWKLIERLVIELADLILDEFKPAAVRVEVKKFILLEARYVSVEARRVR